MFRSFVHMSTWLLSECVLVSVVACVVLMDEMNVSNFRRFMQIHTDVCMCVQSLVSPSASCSQTLSVLFPCPYKVPHRHKTTSLLMLLLIASFLTFFGENAVIKTNFTRGESMNRYEHVTVRISTVRNKCEPG
jgi:hypothetical protein